MELIRHLHNIKPRHRGCVVTIGNFDGVHLGHQRIITQLLKVATETGLPAVVVTFEPHPQEFFLPEDAPARLMRLREKTEYMDKLGVDRILCLYFDQRLASLSAKDFVEEILIEKLDVRHLIIGEDFRFGRDRRGDVAMLKEYGRKHLFEIEIAATCEHGQRRISSSWVREVLAAGDMETASELLGRPYSMSGRVVHGDKRGRDLGYPTLNINLHRRVSPVTGIFVSVVYGLQEEGLPSVTSIGTRPVFSGENLLLETHILDYDRNIYGSYVTVALLQKLRPEEMFESIEALRRQMENDIVDAKNYFKKKNKPVFN